MLSALQLLQNVFQRQLRQQRGEYADSHADLSFMYGAKPKTEYHAVLSENAGNLPCVSRISLGLGYWRLEVSLRQLGLFADGFAPVGARFVFLPERHQGVAQIQQRLGELRVFVQRLLVELDRVLRLSALLADQAGVVEQLGARVRPDRSDGGADRRLRRNSAVPGPARPGRARRRRNRGASSALPGNRAGQPRALPERARRCRR